MSDGAGRYRPLTADERKTAAPSDNAGKAEQPTVPPPEAGSAEEAARKVFRRKPHAIWTYRDANGEPLFHVARFDDDGGKKFSRCAGLARAGKARRGQPSDRSTFSTRSPRVPMRRSSFAKARKRRTRRR